MRSATAPTGTLRRKISRQSSRVSSPPTTGPEVDATEAPSAQIATARARCLASGKAWLIRVRVAGTMTAAAEPEQKAVRPDFDQSDVIFMQVALSAIMESSRAVEPD